VDTTADSPIATAGGTTCADAEPSPKCSLRAAITAADDDSGQVDAVVVPAGMRITLSLGVLTITNSMDIEGAGATVVGAGTGLLLQKGRPDVQVTGLSLTGGTAQSGGAVDCEGGALDLSGVTASGNTATEAGGGLYSGVNCQVWVYGSTFSRNVVEYFPGPFADPLCVGDGGGSCGGGIAVVGSGYISDTTIGGPAPSDGNVGEAGGGLYVQGNVVLDKTVVSWNSTGYGSPQTSSRRPPAVAATPVCGEGAGIQTIGVMSISGSAIEDNVSPGGADGVGFADAGEAQVTGSVISFNRDTNTANPGCDNGAGVYSNAYGLSLVDDTLQGNATVPGVSTSVDGVALYAQDGHLDVSGTRIIGTSAGAPTVDSEVFGGAVYAFARTAAFTDVQVAGTIVQAGNGEILGGAVDLGSSAATFDHVGISGTRATGASAVGGVLFVNSGLEMTSSSIEATTLRIAEPSGACVFGGVILGEGSLDMRQLTIGSTNVDVTPPAASPTAATCLYGGVLDTFPGTTASLVTVTGTNVACTPGQCSVYGGVWDNNGPLAIEESEVVGATVKASYLIQGGLFDTEGGLTAESVTFGDATVGIAGGQQPVGVEGAIFASEARYSGNAPEAILVNATLDDVASTVPALGSFDYGVYSAGLSDVQFESSTIARDSVASPVRGTSLLAATGGTSIALSNSIVASTTPAANCLVGEGSAIISDGHDIDSGHSCAFTGAGDTSNTDPEVMPLDDNGGAVETAALQPPFYVPAQAGSPAVGTGGNCPPTDARGVVRPQGRRCDVGAYELAAQGYWEASGDGGLFHFGAGRYLGSAVGLELRGPIVAVTATPDHRGYWLAGSDGGVFTFGDARFRGSLARVPVAAPIVAMAAGPDGAGYFLVNSYGHVYPFGDATYHGSEDWNVVRETVVGIAATPDGGGYWLATAGGTVLAFGDAVPHGDASGLRLGAPILGITATSDGGGYWLVGADGGVFAFGNARFLASAAGRRTPTKIVAMAVTPDDLGYWLVTAAGGVINLGDASFVGDMSGAHLNTPMSGGASANIGQ
jgi:hypothetical protein